MHIEGRVSRPHRPCKNHAGGWVSPDRKLAAALTKISEGEIGRQLTLASTTAVSDNTVQRGRVLLAIVFRYYAAGSSAQVLYDLDHLQKLTLKGEHRESFQKHLDDGFKRA